MNFTREPIIETIVSPKDGYKLCIRNSKVSGAEELFVDAVEVVSFGNSLFFRGTERPKPFLVPVSDYEVFEVKETRVVLKNVAHDRNIKIGGGREAPVKAPKEQPMEIKEESSDEEVKEPVGAEATHSTSPDPKNDRKRDRRRSRRRRLAEEKKEWVEKAQGEQVTPSEESVDVAPVEEVKTSSSMFAHLLPPPPVLISERLNRLKEEGVIVVTAPVVNIQEQEKDPKVFTEENERLEPSSSTFLEEDEEDFPI